MQSGCSCHCRGGRGNRKDIDAPKMQSGCSCHCRAPEMWIGDMSIFVFVHLPAYSIRWLFFAVTKLEPQSSVQQFFEPKEPSVWDNVQSALFKIVKKPKNISVLFTLSVTEVVVYAFDWRYFVVYISFWYLKILILDVLPLAFSLLPWNFRWRYGRTI